MIDVQLKLLREAVESGRASVRCISDDEFFISFEGNTFLVSLEDYSFRCLQTKYRSSGTYAIKYLFQACEKKHLEEFVDNIDKIFNEDREK
tara:strand:+ start:544 stop:816 length:273 start_codon:yes stop_codon:yes gene_type:complete